MHPTFVPSCGLDGAWRKSQARPTPEAPSRPISVLRAGCPLRRGRRGHPGRRQSRGDVQQAALSDPPGTQQHKELTRIAAWKANDFIEVGVAEQPNTCSAAIGHHQFFPTSAQGWHAACPKAHLDIGPSSSVRRSKQLCAKAFHV